MELIRRQPTSPISDAELNARLHAAIGGAPAVASAGYTSDTPEPGVAAGPTGGPERGPAEATGRGPEPAETLPRRPVLRSVHEFGRAHVAAIGLALACVLGFTSFQLLRAGAEQIPVIAPVSSPTAQPRSASSPTVSVSPALIQVHVIGEVRQPGVVRLPLGARVADAISAAGGLTDRANPGDLNLAAPLADGAQIVIAGGAWPSSTVRAGTGGGDPSVARGSSAPGLVNLNTATADQLEALPGVGPVTAQRILEWRQAHGRFSAVAELQEVAGIGPKLFATLAPLVTV